MRSGFKITAGFFGSSVGRGHPSMVKKVIEALLAVFALSGSLRSEGIRFGTNSQISRMGSDGGTYVAGDSALAYNSLNNEYLVVWYGDDNISPSVAGEYEIFGQRIDAATGKHLGDRIRISDMGPDGDTSYGAYSPAITYNSTNNEYLVVWYGDLAAGEYEIFAQRIQGGTGTELGDNDFRVSNMGPEGIRSYGALKPRVAYNSANNEYFVVWHGDDDNAPLVDNEIEIFAQRIDAATGKEIGDNDFRLSDMGTDGDPVSGAFNPSLAYNPINNEYFVAWFGTDVAGSGVSGETEIFCQRVDAATGEEIGDNDFRLSDMGPDGDLLYSAYSPSVAHNSIANEYLVVWYGDDDIAPLIGGEFEIFGQRLSAATGAPVGDNDFRISDMGPDASPFFLAQNPAISYSPAKNEYVVVWHGFDVRRPSGQGVFGIYGQILDASTGREKGENDFLLSYEENHPSWTCFSPALAPANDRNWFISWEAVQNGSSEVNGDFEIFGRGFGSPDITLASIAPLKSIEPNRGPTGGGTVITITGAGFHSGAQVMLGDVQAVDVAVIGDNLVSARTPAGTRGARDVKVINPDGSTLDLPGAFVYEDKVVMSLKNGLGGVATLFPITGEIKIVFPPECFSRDVTVAVQVPENISAYPGPRSFVTNFRETGIGVEVAVDNGEMPRKSVNMTIGYRDTDINAGEESQVVVASYNPMQRVWTPIASSPEPSSNRVSSQTRHLSLFQLMYQTPAATVSTAKIYPNPFRPSSGHAFVTFTNMPAHSGIKLYSLVGELLRDLTADDVGSARWDGKTSFGEDVASGIYLAFIEGRGKNKTLKVVVQR